MGNQPYIPPHYDFNTEHKKNNKTQVDNKPKFEEQKEIARKMFKDEVGKIKQLEEGSTIYIRDVTNKLFLNNFDNGDIFADNQSRDSATPFIVHKNADGTVTLTVGEKTLSKQWHFFWSDTVQLKPKSSNDPLSLRFDWDGRYLFPVCTINVNGCHLFVDNGRQVVVSASCSCSFVIENENFVWEDTQVKFLHA